MDEGEVGCVFCFAKRGRGDWRVYADMVVDVGLSGGGIGRRGVAMGPVVFDFMVVQRMEPGEINRRALGSISPRRRGIDPAILAAVVSN